MSHHISNVFIHPHQNPIKTLTSVCLRSALFTVCASLHTRLPGAVAKRPALYVAWAGSMSRISNTVEVPTALASCLKLDLNTMVAVTVLGPAGATAGYTGATAAYPGAAAGYPAGSVAGGGGGGGGGGANVLLPDGVSV